MGEALRTATWTSSTRPTRGCTTRMAGIILCNLNSMLPTVLAITTKKSHLVIDATQETWLCQKWSNQCRKCRTRPSRWCKTLLTCSSPPQTWTVATRTTCLRTATEIPQIGPPWMTPRPCVNTKPRSKTFGTKSRCTMCTNTSWTWWKMTVKRNFSKCPLKTHWTISLKDKKTLRKRRGKTTFRLCPNSSYMLITRLERMSKNNKKKSNLFHL